MDEATKQVERCKVMQCDCENKSQDAMYGRWMRLHNFCPGKANYRCTVCGKER